MKIKDIITNPIDKGIIYYIVSFDNDIKQSFEGIAGYDRSGLDLLYFQKSKEKQLSDLVLYLIELYDDFNDTAWNYITKSIISLYKRKWLKLIETYSIEYDAVKPYNMDLEDNLINDYLKSDDSVTTNSHGTDTTNDQYYGFNSNEPVDTNKSIDSGETHSGRKGIYERRRNSKREITRTGNIGNKSAQKLIEEERDMLRWNVYLTIFKDIDKIMCARIWDTEIK